MARCGVRPVPVDDGSLGRRVCCAEGSASSRVVSENGERRLPGSGGIAVQAGAAWGGHPVFGSRVDVGGRRPDGQSGGCGRGLRFATA